MLTSQRVRLPLFAVGCIAASHVVTLGLERLAQALQLRVVLDHLHSIGTITIMLLSGLAFWLLGNALSRRVARVTAVLEQAQRGEYCDEIPVGAEDDVGLMCHSANRLLATAEDRERRIRDSALVDPLTCLPNRTLLNERLRQTLAIADRSRAPFGVVVVDLDRFKLVNDTFGHAAGDFVLREIANRLKFTVRESDTVARMGGDEFVLLLQGGESSVREVTSRIVETLCVPLDYRAQQFDIRASLGVALYPEHGQTDLTLLRNADTAMYQAKRHGSGVVFFDGETTEARRSYLSMVGELRHGLENGQLSLDYQPKLDLRSGLIVGLEGLVRWDHPARGRISPTEFLAFAEQTGVLRDITHWVLEEGVRFAKSLRDGGSRLQVSLNVSAQDLENRSFADLLERVLRHHQLEPEALCLEITESAIVSETTNSIRSLREIAEQGVRLSIDDFGTGYATLVQLQQLPIHEIKIDRSFVSGMNENRASTSVVQSAVGLGKRLGVSVVAEGVETLAELRSLAMMGCDEVQGYYLAKPMASADVAGWVEMRHALYRTSREAYYRMLTSN
jgi:diguanylate cyclase (GGDEF)-like protein